MKDGIACLTLRTLTLRRFEIDLNFFQLNKFSQNSTWNPTYWLSSWQTSLSVVMYNFGTYCCFPIGFGSSVQILTNWKQRIIHFYCKINIWSGMWGKISYILLPSCPSMRQHAINEYDDCPQFQHLWRCKECLQWNNSLNCP